jgi:hypothetical protein
MLDESAEQMTKRKEKKPEWKPKLDIKAQRMENPYFNRNHEVSATNPKMLGVVKNLRESAVETLFARGKLNGAQKRAADKFRGLWEMMGGAGAGANDYAREFVDGGGAKDPIAQRQVDAGKALAECRGLLGARNYDLVQKVCGQGLGLAQISSVKRDQLTAADNLRASLDDLAGLWHFASETENNRRAALNRS